MSFDTFLSNMARFLSKANIRNTVAAFSIFLSFGFLMLIAFHPVPEGNRDLVNVLGGVVIGAAINSVYGWLYTMNKKDKIEP